MTTTARSAFALTTLAATAALADEPRDAGEQTPPAAGFAVVELFTSEGCSSCPPADRLLAEIDAWAEQHGADVYALSFHVDYWNRLGWTDPYSHRQSTERQRSYAAARRSSRVYTPQMIVNGSAEFVGSDARLAARALGRALETGAAASLSIDVDLNDANAETLRVAYHATGSPDDAVINVAVVQNEGRQRVARGENAGRTLRHVNVVREFRSSPVERGGSGVVRIARPADDVGTYRVIAFLQESETKRVVAAASTNPAS
ncbi:MAG: DUF1223 domain-containing protein [Planctomycetota bacterium]